MWLLRKLALPVSLLYALAVKLRNLAYDQGWLTSSSFKTPLICVGNLSVGGTGKTPMVELLLNMLGGKHKIAVLSRGYRRKTSGYLLATADSTAEEIGDEPMQIKQKFPATILAVDADRRRGIRKLEADFSPDLIILDDAYQHRRVKPSLNILLTAYGNLYSDDWYLPTGNLRDSPVQARRAQIVVVTKCPPGLSREEKSDITSKLNLQPGQKLFFSSLSYGDYMQGSPRPIKLEDLKGQALCLVSGIANPGPLLSYLQGKGLNPEHLEYRDHHFFTQKEIELFNSKPLLLTTEKDYMRLKGKVENLYYLPVSHQLMDDGMEELQAILSGL